jgi:hypothetical protein
VPEILEPEPEPEPIAGREEKKAKAESAKERSALASRMIRRKDAAPASPVAGGGHAVAMARSAPKPAPLEPPMVSSLTEASEEAGTAFENPNSREAGLDVLALSDQDQVAGEKSGASNAYASSHGTPSKAMRKALPRMAPRGRSAGAEADAEESGEAMAARKAGGGGLWRVPGLLLEWNPKADPETFFDGIEELGIRILRSEESRIYRYELLVPAGSLDSLETYLRAQGKVTKVPKHLSAGRAGGPAVITLRIQGDFSGR